MLLDGAWGSAAYLIPHTPQFYEPSSLCLSRQKLKEEARVGTWTLTQAQIQLERWFRHGNLMTQTIIKHSTRLTAKLEQHVN